MSTVGKYVISLTKQDPPAHIHSNTYVNRLIEPCGLEPAPIHLFRVQFLEKKRYEASLRKKVLEIDPIPVLSRKEGINQLINKKKKKRKISTAIYTDQ